MYFIDKFNSYILNNCLNVWHSGEVPNTWHVIFTCMDSGYYNLCLTWVWAFTKYFYNDTWCSDKRPTGSGRVSPPHPTPNVFDIFLNPIPYSRLGAHFLNQAHHLCLKGMILWYISKSVLTVIFREQVFLPPPLPHMVHILV